MTIKELIAELNEMVINGEVNENAKIINADMDNIFSIVDNNEDEVVIYFE